MHREVLKLQEKGHTDIGLELAAEAWALANKNNDGLGKGHTLATIASLYQQEGQTQESLGSLLEAMDNFEQVEFLEGAAYLKILIAKVYVELSAFEKAAEYYGSAYQNYLDADNDLGKELCLEQAGLYSLKAENYPQAIAHFEKLLELYHSLEKQSGVIYALRYLVMANNRLHYYQIALQHNFELLEIYLETGDSLGASHSYNNIGYCYSHLEDYQNALHYFQKAFALDQQVDDSNEKDAFTLINIGVAYQNMGQLDEAINSFQSSLSIFQEIQHDSTNAANLMNMVALVQLQRGYVYEAGNMIEKGIKLAKASNSPQVLQKCYETYSQILQASNNYEQALEYYKEFLALRDSLQLQDRLQLERMLEKQDNIERKDRELQLELADEARKDLINRQLQLEAEANQQELELMRSEQAIQDYMLRQQELEKERALQALAITRQRHEAQLKENQIENLEKEQQIRDLQLVEKERAAKERQLRIDLLEQEKRYVERDRNRARMVNALLLVISLLVVAGLVHTLRTKRALGKQKKEIETKNDQLNLKNEEILTQSEKLQHAMDEIGKQHDEIQQQYAKLTSTHQALKTTQTKLVQAEKMASLGLLTAGIAHEINNPINFVSGNVKPLKRDLDDLVKFITKARQLDPQNNIQEELRELSELAEALELDYIIEEIQDLLSGIEEGAARTKEIVLGLKNFSRLDEDERKTADLHAGIDSTLTILGSKLRHKHIEVIRDYGSIPVIECLPGQLNQAFMNIIGNAIDALQDKGQIVLKTWEDEQNVFVSIKDNGRGIPPSIQDKIFDPFFTTKDVGEGTGLGLSITYGIIERHEGEIKVESKMGKGTQFTIILPKSPKLVEAAKNTSKP